MFCKFWRPYIYDDHDGISQDSQVSYYDSSQILIYIKHMLSGYLLLGKDGWRITLPMISLVLPTASLVSGDGQPYNFIGGMVGAVRKVVGWGKKQWQRCDSELTFFFALWKSASQSQWDFFSGPPRTWEPLMGKLPIRIPEDMEIVWDGKLTIKGSHVLRGPPFHHPWCQAPGSRCGEGDYDMELVQPRICPPSVPRMFVPKSTLATKTGRGRETSCSIYGKTRIWRVYGDNLEDFLKIWIVGVGYWISFADLFIWLFLGLKPNCQTWDFFRSTLNGLHWAKKKSDH